MSGRRTPPSKGVCSERYIYHLVANAQEPTNSCAKRYRKPFFTELPPLETMSISKSLLVTLAALRGVHGWGVLGHATVAYVAQHYLNADTASWLVSLSTNFSVETAPRL